MVTHSSIRACVCSPWGPQRVRNDWSNLARTHVHVHTHVIIYLYIRFINTGVYLYAYSNFLVLDTKIHGCSSTSHEML